MDIGVACPENIDRLCFQFHKTKYENIFSFNY